VTITYKLEHIGSDFHRTQKVLEGIQSLVKRLSEQEFEMVQPRPVRLLEEDESSSDYSEIEVIDVSDESSEMEVLGANDRIELTLKNNAFIH
jgi:hypothetical protein